MAYLLAALLGGALLFNSKASPGKVEQMTETALRGRYPGASVDVDVKGKRGMSTLKGKFKRFDVAMSNFDLGAAGGGAAGGGLAFSVVPSAKHRGRLGQAQVNLRNFAWNDLKVEAAEFSFQNVVYDRDALKDEQQVKIVSVGPGRARLLVPAASLQALLATRLKSVQDAKLTLQNGQVRVQGRRDVLGLPVEFTLTAKPQPRNGNEVWLADPRVNVEGGAVSLPASALMGDLNPIYVFDRERRWPFRVQITAIQAQADKLEISGDLVFVPAAAPVSGP